MPYVAGVDLGTSCSAAAIAGPDGVAAVDLGTQAMVTPSVVAMRPDGEILTGTAAARRLVLEPSRAAREFKRRLGDPTPLLLGGVPYGAETLSGYLLRSIVGLIAEREGEPPTLIGLSHPANYGNYKLGLLEEAARVAEIPSVVFVPEPVAAAVHYSQAERVNEGDLIAVYDLGGGTFDASVVRSTGEGFNLIGRPDGMDRFGGIDMDEAVLGHVRSVLGDDLLGVDGEDSAVISALARLREECCSAKEALSGDTEAAIPVMLPGLHTEVRITRAEFEDMIRPRLRETIGVLERTVTSAGVEMVDLTRVLLVGGSSRIPLVGEMVRQTTGRPVGLDAHPKLTVALGAALVALDSYREGAIPSIGTPPPPEPPVEAEAELLLPEQEEPTPALEYPDAMPTAGEPHEEVRSDQIRHRLRGTGRWWGMAAAVVAVVALIAVIIVVVGGRSSSTSDAAAISVAASTSEAVATSEATATTQAAATTEAASTAATSTAAVQSGAVALQIRIASTSDWVDVRFEEGLWVDPTEVVLLGGEAVSWGASLTDLGVLVLGLSQEVQAASAGEEMVLIIDVALVPDVSDPSISFSQGEIGATTIEVYDNRHESPALLATTSGDSRWAPVLWILLSALGIG